MLGRKANLITHTYRLGARNVARDPRAQQPSSQENGQGSAACGALRGDRGGAGWPCSPALSSAGLCAAGSSACRPSGGSSPVAQPPPVPGLQPWGSRSEAEARGKPTLSAQARGSGSHQGVITSARQPRGWPYATGMCGVQGVHLGASHQEHH